LVEIIGYDTEYSGEKAAAGARKLAEVDKVVIVNQLGGGPDMPAVPILTENKIISTTSLSCDINPEGPYHCCPCEWWPMDMPLAADLFFREHPEVETLAYVCQNDEIGINCLANFAAVARTYGVELVHEKLFDPETVDFAPIISDAIASGADAITLGSAYPDFTTLMMEQCYLQGWDGPMFGSVLDFYDAIAERTSYEYIEGYIFAYPDWDDPALNPSPNPYCTIQPIDFWEENNAKYPGTWTANTWEHLGRLEVWKQGVILADSIEPMKVWEAWKTAPELYHVYGQGQWGGKELYGLDNCLFAPWPIVQMQEGHARTVELVNGADWLATGQNLDVLIEELEKYELTWYQLLGLTRAEAMEQYPESF
jgi:branched-chain amino acid transport system substrate-binding protein